MSLFQNANIKSEFKRTKAMWRERQYQCFEQQQNMNLRHLNRITEAPPPQTPGVTCWLSTTDQHRQLTSVPWARKRPKPHSGEDCSCHLQGVDSAQDCLFDVTLMSDVTCKGWTVHRTVSLMSPWCLMSPARGGQCTGLSL